MPGRDLRLEDCAQEETLNSYRGGEIPRFPATFKILKDEGRYILSFDMPEFSMDPARRSRLFLDELLRTSTSRGIIAGEEDPELSFSYDEDRLSIHPSREQPDPQGFLPPPRRLVDEYVGERLGTFRMDDVVVARFEDRDASDMEWSLRVLLASYAYLVVENPPRKGEFTSYTHPDPGQSEEGSTLARRPSSWTQDRVGVNYEMVRHLLTTLCDDIVGNKERRDVVAVAVERAFLPEPEPDEGEDLKGEPLQKGVDMRSKSHSELWGLLEGVDDLGGKLLRQLTGGVAPKVIPIPRTEEEGAPRADSWRTFFIDTKTETGSARASMLMSCPMVIYVPSITSSEYVPLAYVEFPNMVVVSGRCRSLLITEEQFMSVVEAHEVCLLWTHATPPSNDSLRLSRATVFSFPTKEDPARQVLSIGLPIAGYGPRAAARRAWGLELDDKRFEKDGIMPWVVKGALEQDYPAVTIKAHTGASVSHPVQNICAAVPSNHQLRRPARRQASVGGSRADTVQNIAPLEKHCVDWVIRKQVGESIRGWIDVGGSGTSSAGMYDLLDRTGTAWELMTSWCETCRIARDFILSERRRCRPYVIHLLECWRRIPRGDRIVMPKPRLGDLLCSFLRTITFEVSREADRLLISEAMGIAPDDPVFPVSPYLDRECMDMREIISSMHSRVSFGAESHAVGAERAWIWLESQKYVPYGELVAEIAEGVRTRWFDQFVGRVSSAWRVNFRTGVSQDTSGVGFTVNDLVWMDSLRRLEFERKDIKSKGVVIEKDGCRVVLMRDASVSTPVCVETKREEFTGNSLQPGVIAPILNTQYDVIGLSSGIRLRVERERKKGWLGEGPESRLSELTTYSFPALRARVRSMVISNYTDEQIVGGVPSREVMEEIAKARAEYGIPNPR